jgi:MYXO-CTERM domain-containing protein
VEIGTCESPEDVVVEGGGLLCAASPARTDRSAGWLIPLALGGLLVARRRRRRS